MPVSPGTPITRTRLPKSREYRLYSAFSAKDFRAYGHIHIAGRLAQLSLDSLYCRRVKADLLVCYKILHNRVHLNCDDFFSHSCVDCSRGNTMKLAMTHVYSARDSNFFSNRVINIWNALPDSIKSPSVNSFKSKINSLHFVIFELIVVFDCII